MGAVLLARKRSDPRFTRRRHPLLPTDPTYLRLPSGPIAWTRSAQEPRPQNLSRRIPGVAGSEHYADMPYVIF